jgi:hypothetical protein
MVTDGAHKRSDVARLMSEIRAAKVELLSAQCAVDRLRLQYSLRDIVAFGERQTLEGAIASARALHRFFSEIEAEFAATAGKQPHSSPSSE